MKKIRILFTVLVASFVLFAGCKPDRVNPTGKAGNNVPTFDGMVEDDTLHVTIDTICSNIDTIQLMSQHDGSLTISKCISAGQAVPCTTSTQWGDVVLFNGVFYGADNIYNTGDDVEYFVAKFSCNGGYFIDASQSYFGQTALLQLDTNGVPIIGNDWIGNNLVDDVSQWILYQRMDDIPSRCFTTALNLTVYKLNLYSRVVPGSNTTLWGYNPDWNDPQDPAYSPTSALLTPFCAPQCLFPVIATEDECKNVFTGLNCNTGCVELTPNVSEFSGSLSYEWSDGALNSSVIVCPTVPTDYDVTISEDGDEVKIVHFDITPIDVGCAIGITNDPRAKFCAANLDVKYNMTFNIRDYVTMHDGSSVDWNNVHFTYTAVGANNMPTPSDWHLSDFNNGDDVTVTSADVAWGSGNEGRGQYRVYIYRTGETTYDSYLTIRVNNNRSSNINSAKCNGGNCGFIPGVKVCHIPPGNPGGATTNCVTYSTLDNYISNYCSPGTPVGSSSNPGDYLGVCGGNPCIQ